MQVKKEVIQLELGFLIERPAAKDVTPKPQALYCPIVLQ